VTIEGSLSPCDELPRGVRRTVMATERVRRLAEAGHVIVVEGKL